MMRRRHSVGLDAETNDLEMEEEEEKGFGEELLPPGMCAGM